MMLADPTLIQPFSETLPFGGSPYPTDFATPSLQFQSFVEQPPSPAPSNTSSHNLVDSRRFKRSGSQSPYLHQQSYQPYPAYNSARRPSAASVQSRQSQTSGRSNSFELDEESREKGMCPIEGCGRVFKDLKAHMLTHQSERPEKCPITSCVSDQPCYASDRLFLTRLDRSTISRASPASTTRTGTP